MVISTKIDDEDYEMPFIIDYEDYDKVKKYNWHRTGKYASFTTMKNTLTTTIYLQQIIMGNVSDEKLRISFKNRIPQDNRKENLRLVTQTVQNSTQKKKIRNVELPEDCGFTADEIPTGISYKKSDGKHDACFEIAMRKDGKFLFRKKTSQSKDKSLIEKLQEAKDILKQIQKEHPEYFGNKTIDGELSDEGKKLYDSYYDILDLAEIEDPIDHE